MSFKSLIANFSWVLASVITAATVVAQQEGTRVFVCAAQETNGVRIHDFTHGKATEYYGELLAGGASVITHQNKDGVDEALLNSIIAWRA